MSGVDKRSIVPEQWAYVEKHFPGAFMLWQLTIGLPSAEFRLGVTGRPAYAVAIDTGCYEPAYAGCRCHWFKDGAWSPRMRGPISEVTP